MTEQVDGPGSVPTGDLQDPARRPELIQPRLDLSPKARQRIARRGRRHVVLGRESPVVLDLLPDERVIVHAGHPPWSPARPCVRGAGQKPGYGQPSPGAVV